MTEIWKDIKGYEGLYEISNYGEVWSVRKQTLLTKCETSGYHCVGLTKNKKRKHFKVHRLVANNFVDNPFNKPCVNHLDENKINNHHSNLEWVTHEENANYGTRNERIKETRKSSSKWKAYNKRRKWRDSKPIVGVNIKNGNIIEFSSATEAGRNGYVRSNISRCANGKRSVHKGHRWYYKHDFIERSE
ncbi:HNH endonuclease [Mammaliicoccus sciuri]|uniref:NUMOD4 domain-containing protein n=1 Tax=Mammaliicoccus sciuri TaxID=1296 RepID=UPI001C639725|nr:NUMOD4 domain-containing protein [Mammaliicoccus sciuri]QYG31004.1 HNH endonuclease [Mammaliicoccus sciuri]